MKQNTLTEILQEALLGKRIKFYKSFYNAKEPEKFIPMTVEPVGVPRFVKTIGTITAVTTTNYGDEGIGMNLDVACTSGNVTMNLEMTDTVTFV